MHTSTQTISELPTVTHAHFGEHLTIDAYQCSSKLLNDEGNVFRCLDHLPEHLGMHKLSKPHVHFAEGTGSKDPGGWSGYVIIEESHIGIHTFPHFEFVSIDVYTCQNGLDISKIRTFFKKSV
jgi:S-adenosylmethionine decarboxylase